MLCTLDNGCRISENREQSSFSILHENPQKRTLITWLCKFRSENHSSCKVCFMSAIRQKISRTRSGKCGRWSKAITLLRSIILFHDYVRMWLRKFKIMRPVFSMPYRKRALSAIFMNCTVIDWHIDTVHWKRQTLLLRHIKRFSWFVI